MFPSLPLRFNAHSFMDFAIQLQMHVYGRNQEQFTRWEQHKDLISSRDQVLQWQEHIRKCVESSIGGLPAANAPLNPRVCGELNGEGFRVQKVIYDSQPGVPVTSSLYLPDGVSEATGAVLFVCGHAEEAKGAPLYQSVCQRLAKNGMVVLAVDPPGQGERKSYLGASGKEIVRWGTEEHDYAGLQCWFVGQSCARYFVHDARRGIDYLLSRDEVDGERIGATGNSGGGTQTTWLMMLEPRLAAAAPSCFVMRRLEYMWTGQAQDSEQMIPSGTLNGIDHEDFLIAMAPRPVMVLATDYDFFCTEGTRKTVQRAKRIYRLLGKEENLGLTRDRVTHQYSPVLARAATEFFCRHLLGRDASDVDLSNPKPFDPKQVWCTEHGQLLIDHPTTKCIFHRNVDSYEQVRDVEVDAQAQAHKAAAWLSSGVHRCRKQCDLNARWPWDDEVQGLRICHGFWFTEPGICNAGFFLRPAASSYERLEIVVFDRGTHDIERRRIWLQDRIKEGFALLIVDLRGMGHLAPRQISPGPLEERYGTVFKLISDLVCIGDDLASMRVFDLLRAVELAHTDPLIDLDERPLRVFGSGLGGFYAYIAGALTQRVAALEIEDTLFSLDALVRTRYYHDDRLNQTMMYGMAAQFDLPDMLPLFSERELTIRRPRDAEGNILIKYEFCPDDQPVEDSSELPLGE